MAGVYHTLYKLLWYPPVKSTDEISMVPGTSGSFRLSSRYVPHMTTWEDVVLPDGWNLELGDTPPLSKYGGACTV